MATSISAILIPCLRSFNKLQEQVEQPDYSHEEEVARASWGDELGRLRVWAANIGAHQTGQSSLDFRLRDASHISKQITDLFRDLGQSLHDIFKELSDDKTEASDYDEPDAFWPGREPTTELQQLYEEVTNIIDCLYQLSMLIRKPAQHDLLIGSRLSDKAEFDFYDKEHVRNLHPKSEEQTSQRLGRAITRRRKYLLYRERHHKKLEKGIEEVQGVQRAGTWSTISETIATDFQTPNIDFEDTSSNSGLSETSYAPSLIDGGRITIPPPPKESVGGKPFECPYCFFVIEIKSTRSWNRHIFRDIKPYVCTFPDCSLSDRLYDSRREWFFHEKTEHHREDFVCPLCRDTLSSPKQYERHVARHLEELALFALPRTEIEDAEDDDENKAEYNSEDPIAADSASSESSVEGEEGLDASSLSAQLHLDAKLMDLAQVKIKAQTKKLREAAVRLRKATSHDPSHGSSAEVGSELKNLGGDDSDATASSLGNAVIHAAAMNTTQLEPSGVMNEMDRKASHLGVPEHPLHATEIPTSPAYEPKFPLLPAPIITMEAYEPKYPRPHAMEMPTSRAYERHYPPPPHAPIIPTKADEPEQKQKKPSLLRRLWPSRRDDLGGLEQVAYPERATEQLEQPAAARERRSEQVPALYKGLEPSQ